MAVWSEATAPSCYDHTFAAAFQPLYICIYTYIYIYIYIHIYIYKYLCVCTYVLWHGVTLIPWPPQEPTPLRFPVWLGIPKPMIPYPLLWEGAVRTVGSHLGRIPNCSEVPDTPPPPPREPPSLVPLPKPPPPRTPPPPKPPPPF